MSPLAWLSEKMLWVMSYVSPGAYMRVGSTILTTSPLLLALKDGFPVPDPPEPPDPPFSPPGPPGPPGPPDPGGSGIAGLLPGGLTPPPALPPPAAGVAGSGPDGSGLAGLARLLSGAFAVGVSPGLLPGLAAFEPFSLALGSSPSVSSPRACSSCCSVGAGWSIVSLAGTSL